MSTERMDALVRTLETKKETVAEVLDTAMEVVFDEKVGTKIPIFSWALAAGELFSTFRKERLRKNVKAYLGATGEASEENRRRISDEMRSDPAFAEEFTDATLSVLLDATRPIKAEVLGNLTAAFAEGKIESKRWFLDLVFIVDAASIPSLLALETYVDRVLEKGRENTPHEEPLLLAMGVAWRLGTEGFRLSEHGKSLYEMGFKKILSKRNV